MELIRDPKTGMYLTSEKGDCSGNYVSQKDYDEKAAAAEEYYMLEEHLKDLVKAYSYTLVTGWDKKYKNQKVSQILHKLFQQIFSPEFIRDQAIRYCMIPPPKEDKKEVEKAKLSATATKLMSSLDKKQWIFGANVELSSVTPGTIIVDDITMDQFLVNTATTTDPVPQDNPETGFANTQTDF